LRPTRRSRMSSLSPPSTVPSSGPRLHPLAGLALGLVAGILVWGLTLRVHPVYQMPRELYLNMGAPDWQVHAHRAEVRSIDRRHAMLYLSVLGALLGLLLGIGEGVMRRSVLPVLGLLPLGVAGGALGGFLASLVQDWVRANVGLAEIRHTVAAQLALCLPLAGGIGLGLGLATQSLSGFIKTLLAGLAAGALAAVVYPLATSLLLPGVSTDSIMPEQAGSRLLWLCLMAGLIGLVTPLAGRQRRTVRTPPLPSAA
jgi:hypothetical protein